MTGLNEGLSQISKFLVQNSRHPSSTAELAGAILELEQILDTKLHFEAILRTIRRQLNDGASPAQILDAVFEPLRSMIPLDRMGVGQLDPSARVLRTLWHKSALPQDQTGPFHDVPIDQTSFRDVMASRQPQIFNDLEDYAERHPDAILTRTFAKMGISSNMIFPLLANAEIKGFIYFASTQKHAYDHEDIGLLQDVADEFTLVVEHGRLQKYFESGQSKDRALAMVVHDLKSPLNVINGFLGLVKEESWFATLEEGPKEIFEALIRNAEVMKSLLAGLSFSEPALSLQTEVVPLHSFLTNFIKDAEVFAGTKQMSFVSHIDRDLPLQALLDSKRIHQVLQNLVSNAIKFSYPFTNIFFDVVVCGDRLVFSILDQGQGIPPEEIPKLFQWKGRTSVCPTADEGSSGLGLYIAKRIVDLHGGALNVESRFHAGSRFHFWIPLLKPS